ncbi:TPA: ABC transporter ATP-binding protein, partial [Aeromonas hydrophila]|nr:ABC transporter ATP-binding protein [Aeromonas hydrophila]
VSHNPAYGALADRVLRLEGGQLVELKGRHHD